LSYRKQTGKKKSTSKFLFEKLIYTKTFAVHRRPLPSTAVWTATFTAVRRRPPFAVWMAKKSYGRRDGVAVQFPTQS
jgi:hypothetical protein